MDAAIGIGDNVVQFKTSKTYTNCEIAVQKVAITNDRFSGIRFTGYVLLQNSVSYNITNYVYTIDIPENVSLQIVCDLINSAVSAPTAANIATITASIINNSMVINMFSLEGFGAASREFTYYLSASLATFLPSIVKNTNVVVGGITYYEIAVANRIYGYIGTNNITVFPPPDLVTWSILSVNNNITLVQKTAISDPITTFLIEPMIGGIISAAIVQPNSPFVFTLLPESNNQMIVYEFLNLQWVRVSYLPQNFSISLYHIGETKDTPLKNTAGARIQLLIRS
jgi:hypothetical protein